MDNTSLIGQTRPGGTARIYRRQSLGSADCQALRLDAARRKLASPKECFLKAANRSAPVGRMVGERRLYRAGFPKPAEPGTAIAETRNERPDGPQLGARNSRLNGREGSLTDNSSVIPALSRRPAFASRKLGAPDQVRSDKCNVRNWPSADIIPVR